MEIVKGRPPVYDKIVARIGTPPATAVYAWGDTVYTPEGTLDLVLAVHEAVHGRQQVSHDGGIEGWWEQYLEDTEFRLHQELQAYRAQYRFVCIQEKDRNAQARACFSMASALAGTMYGRLIPLTKAMTAIRST